MPLDPQVVPILEEAERGLPLPDLSPQEARDQMRANAAPVDPECSAAEVRDIEIPGGRGPIPTRLYYPGRDGPLPLVAFFHGGGWVIGDLETHDAICHALACRSGCIVASVDYRLAPEHPYPAAAEDSYDATRWLAENAASLGANAHRLAVCGDSAGGNLAAVVPLMARERGGPAIAFQVLIYPVTDCDFERASYRDNAEGYMLTRDAMIWFWDHYLSDADARRAPHASPLHAAELGKLPDALVITAEYDPLRDECEAYARKLEEAGVPVTLTRYDGMIHGFFRMTAKLDQAKRALEEVAGALGKVLGE